MHYQFLIWDALMANELHPTMVTATCSKPRLMNQCKMKFVEETKRIKQAFPNSLFEQSSVHQCVLYVQQHQYRVTQILNQLVDILNCINSEKEKALYSCFQQSIFDVWEFIELMSVPYLDKTVPLAVSISERKLKTIEARYKAILRLFQNSNHVSQAIVQLIEKYWQSLFITVQSYQTLAYTMELLTCVNQWLEKTTEQVPIHQLLVQMNFNSQGYIDDITQQIMQEVTNIDQPMCQYEYLLQQYQCINKWVVLTKGSPYPELPNLKPYLLHWLKVEIQVFEKKVTFLNQRMPDPNTILQFNATVKALAIIGRAAFDTKLILNHNKTEVYQWLSGHLATIGSDAVSYKTLYKRGSQPALKDKELAKEILMQLYNQIRKY